MVVVDVGAERDECTSNKEKPATSTLAYTYTFKLNLSVHKVTRNTSAPSSRRLAPTGDALSPSPSPAMPPYAHPGCASFQPPCSEHTTVAVMCNLQSFVVGRDTMRRCQSHRRSRETAP